jgi:hypothetical protein
MLKNTYIPLSAPNIIRLKQTVNEYHHLNKEAITAFTEENILIDRDGVHGRKGAKKLLIIHGGGALHPERIKYGYDHDLLEDGFMRYTDDEAANMLTGILPSGDSFPVYTLDFLYSNEITDPIGRYGVIMDLEEAANAKKKISGEDFFSDKLFLARAGKFKHVFDYILRRSDGNYMNYGLVNDHSYDSQPIMQSGRYLRISRDRGMRLTPVNEHASFVGLKEQE